MSPAETALALGSRQGAAIRSCMDTSWTYRVTCAAVHALYETCARHRTARALNKQAAQPKQREAAMSVRGHFFETEDCIMPVSGQAPHRHPSWPWLQPAPCALGQQQVDHVINIAVLNPPTPRALVRQQPWCLTQNEEPGRRAIRAVSVYRPCFLAWRS